MEQPERRENIDPADKPKPQDSQPFHSAEAARSWLDTKQLLSSTRDLLEAALATGALRRFTSLALRHIPDLPAHERRHLTGALLQTLSVQREPELAYNLLQDMPSL